MQTKFLNPYQFIPLQDKISDVDADVDKSSYTGVINYKITTKKTPLFIPGEILHRDYEKDDKEEATGHPYKRFFTYDNTNGDLSLKKKYRPSIPGSEIRGVIRSIYETLTNSCLSMIDGDEPIARRVNDAFLPGLIQRTEVSGKVNYTLLQAEKAVINFSKIGKQKEGEVCKGDVSKGGPVRYFDIKKTGRITGYLLKGEIPQKSTKTHYSIMYLNSTKPQVVTDLTETDLENLQNILSVYNDPRVNVLNKNGWYVEYKESLDKFLSGQLSITKGKVSFFPVYYYEINGKKQHKLYLSPACITKEIYNTKVKSIIPGYHACKDKKNLCPACHLFGMVGDTNEDSVAGKLRFTDLTPKKAGDCSDYYYNGRDCDKNGMVTLKELSNPKPSASEFYLQKPKNENGEILNWNYDYYIYSENEKTKYMLSEDGYIPKIMGRKYYFHNLSPQFSISRKEIDHLKDPDKNPKNKRNQSVQLVAENKTFEGKIYFEGISRTELLRLIWICDISNLTKNMHGYKIGGAKPLGLGSVETCVTSVYERTIFIDEKGNVKYKQEELKIKDLFGSEDLDEYYKIAKFDEKVRKAFLMMTKFINEFTVSYPIAYETDIDEQNQKKADGYLWFFNNQIEVETGRRDKLLKRKNMQFEQNLESLGNLKPSEGLEKLLLHSTVKGIKAKKTKQVEKTKKKEKTYNWKDTSAEENINYFNYECNQLYDVTVVEKTPCKNRKHVIIKFVNLNHKTGETKLEKSEAKNIQIKDTIKVRCIQTGSHPKFEYISH